MYGGLAVIIAITIIGIGISAIPQADAQTMTNATMPNAVDDNATSNGIDTLVIDVTANDELAGALIERLAVVRQSGPSGLDVTTAANTHVIYQPSINDRLIANGTTAIYTYTLTLNVTDAMSNTRTETITADVNITFVFEAGLEAVDDIAATVQNKTVDIDVLVNDVYRGDTLPTVVSARDPNNGTVTLSDNTFTYTPNENYTGIDTFVYNLTDADGGIDNATVTIEINADVAPMAVDDNATSNKVDTLYINATANDMPPTALIASLDFGSLYANFTGVGTITHNDTHIIYQPSAQDRLLPDGTEINFQYTIHVPSLELGLTDSTTIEMITATVTITLDAGLEPIDAVDDNIKTTPNTPVEINVTANDTYDRDGPPVVPIILSHPEHGTLNFSTVNNTITYTPDADHPGQDTFVYQITDIVNGGTDNATVTVTVTGAPTRAPDIDVEATPGELTTVQPDIGNGTITSAMGATMGTINEALLVDGTIAYTANVGASGIDTVLYTVDGISQGTVRFYINAEGNDRPVLETIPGVQAEEDTVTFQVMSEDNDTQTYAIRNAPQGATISNTTGAFSWNTTGFEPGDYIFDIIVHDDSGGLDVQKMAITVRDPANDNPTAPVVHRSTTTDAPILVTPDIRDPEGLPTGMILAVGADKGNVREEFLEANIIAYVPVQNGTDIISYTTSDGAGGATTSTVYVHTGTSADPDLDTIGIQRVNVTQNLAFRASATDADNNETSYIMSGAPDGATLDESTGAFSWTPAASDVGDYTFTITAYDGQGGFDTESVAISVSDPDVDNDDPNISDFDSAARQNNPRFIALETSDPDDDPTGLILATGATTGTIRENLLQFGIITYVPEVDDTGTDTVTYVVSDGRGGASTGTIYVHVRDPANNEPVLEAVGNQHVNASDTLTFEVHATDAIMIRSDEPSARATTESGHEVLIWSGPPTEDRRLEIVVAVLNPDGDLVEHLNYDFMVTQNGTTVLNEMDVHHHTGQGSRITSALESSSPLDITITLQGLGVGAADTRADPKGETVTFDQVSGTAMIAAHTGGMIREDMPSGMANVTADDGTEYQVLIWHGPPTEGLRLEVFMAVLNPDGSLVDHLNYDIMVQQDGNDVLDLEDVHHHTGQGSRITSALGSNSSIDTTITVQGFGVGPVGDRPGPVNKSATFTQTSGGELMMHGAHSLTFGIRNAPAGATMTHDGAFSWTPETANAGDHEFTIAVHDDAGGFATEDIIVTVTDTGSANQNPVAPDGAATTAGNRTVVVLDITDPDEDDKVTIIAAAGAMQGLIDTEFFKDAVLAYTPFPGASGTDTITYTVSDGNGGLATGTVTITISAPSGS